MKETVLIFFQPCDLITEKSRLKKFLTDHSLVIIESHARSGTKNHRADGELIRSREVIMAQGNIIDLDGFVKILEEEFGARSHDGLEYHLIDERVDKVRGTHYFT